VEVKQDFGYFIMETNNMEQRLTVTVLIHVGFAYYRVTVAYLLKAKNWEPEKQPLLGNDCVTRNNG
jgi:hypothetical protein